MTAGAREEVLDRVRRAAATATADGVNRSYRGADDGPASIELLVARLEDYRASVARCAPADVARVVAELVQGRVLAPEGFPEPWLRLIDAVPDNGLTAAELDQVDTVVALCALAIAETGTIVLDAGPGQGRRAITLVPDRLVLVVRESQVVASVPQGVARLDPRRPQTWISGPSATSDIELQRVEGVHGPRTLIVVIVADA